jgi:hypothetical protein
VPDSYPEHILRVTGLSFEEESGDTVWQFETDRPIWSSPTVVDWTLYVRSNGGTLYAIDAGVNYLGVEWFERRSLASSRKSSIQDSPALCGCIRRLSLRRKVGGVSLYHSSNLA